MTLPEQIIDLYPQVTYDDFINGNINLQNDDDGLGDYIKLWNYPGLEHPPFGYDPHEVKE